MSILIRRAYTKVIKIDWRKLEKYYVKAFLIYLRFLYTSFLKKDELTRPPGYSCV